MTRNLYPCLLIASIAACIIFFCLIKSIPIFSHSSAPIVEVLYIQSSNNSNTTIDIKNLTIHMKSILKTERSRYLSKLGAYFQFTKEKVGLTSLTPETNGQPLQSVVLSTWGTGSTFLAEILNSLPGNYPHFEPLQYMENVRVHDSSKSLEAFYVMRQMLKCNYTGLERQYTSLDKFVVSNDRLSEICKAIPKMCINPKFLNAFCRIFPFQSMNLIRLPVEYSEVLLTDPDLNVKIIVLVRDPRDVMISRKQLDWCQDETDCNSSTNLCNDMVSDFNAAQILTQKYPDQFKVVRYEDFSSKPFDKIEEILDFYGLPFHAKMKDYLKSYTQGNSSQPFEWLHNISSIRIDEIQDIQSNCDEAMSLWGYNQINNEPKFNPLLASPFDLREEETERDKEKEEEFEEDEDEDKAEQ